MNASPTGVRRALLLGTAALLAAAPAFALPGSPVSAAVAAPQCAEVNGSFEQPSGLRGQGHQLRDVPGWRTTASDGIVEIWGAGNKADPMNFTVPADSGSQFAEISATGYSALYQDIVTTPGATIRWSLAHRARTAGGKTDTMRVRIGGVLQTPDGKTSPDIVDGNAAWGHYSGSYPVPAGQVVTRVEFLAVSSGAGYASYGNFLDSVKLSCDAAPGNKPPTAPDVVLSGPVGKELTGALDSKDPEGGKVTYTVTDPGKLPPGMTVAPGGAVSGTPTAEGTYRVPVKACDEQGACAEGEVVVVVHECPEPEPVETDGRY